ncbi:MAG: Dual-specificity kinase, spindle pole body (SPB) duplication and spindle checkpoint function [Sclerophora amabilis]|nr:MAG: Dual-specificity kinase, spindle pole body (SPB) duplication and spindle checkpoint function [Sclerophora amabilis]
MVASPTPFSSTTNGGLSHRTSKRPAPRHISSRPTLRRASPLRTKVAANGTSNLAAISQLPSVGDSSDDELPVPMKFSALTKALLNQEASMVEASSPSAGPDLNGEKGLIHKSAHFKESSTAGKAKFNYGHHKETVPEECQRSPVPRRVVRLSGGSAGSATLRKAKTASVDNSPQQSEELSRADGRTGVSTPAPRSRSNGLRDSMAQSGHSPGAVSNEEKKPGLVEHLNSENDGPPGAPRTVGGPRTNRNQVSVPRQGAATVGRTKQAEETGLQGSLRIKRLGKVHGSFLSGPARRGRRRQSEEDQSPAQADLLQSPSDLRLPEGNQDGGEKMSEAHGMRPMQDVGEMASRENAPAQELDEIRVVTNSPTPIEQLGKENEYVSPSNSPPLGLSASRITSNPAKKPLEHHAERPFKVPALPPLLPSKHDQENEPPPTFKRGNVSAHTLLEREKKATVFSEKQMLGDSPAFAPSERKALAPRSQNTPLRPAPPPPKMSVLETATTNAGAAATSHLKKKRNYVSVNGKVFNRLDCIGRGGSSRVYRVMAENYKVFALKKVALEDVDEITLRGYKGEIELLRKLDHVQRVVTLYDWELNDEKKSLSVLMEIGETDLNKIINLRLNPENAKFEINFVRHYWKEMLECVQSVHQYDVVHSDLKPANFVLVKGCLKLIDFGIANAIQDDTVNVHREQQVGTPNYMSPEAIVDSNAKSGLPASSGRMMKLGKASDVWSLGCILYQMVYGKPPFAHITNQYERIMAIPNPRHHIAFPSKGLGGVPVPAGLIKTLKGCLDRDQHLRPTAEQLLDEKNVFLYPDAEREGSVEMSQEVLGLILSKVVTHCQQKGFPSSSELAAWPAGFITKLNRELDDGG